MRILIVGPNYNKRVNWGHQKLKDALMRVAPAYDCKAIQYGEGFKHRGSFYMPEVIKEVDGVLGKPDVLFFENQKNMQKYCGVGEVSAFKVLYIGDYLPDGRGNIAAYNRLIREWGIHLVLCPTFEVERLFIKNKDKGEVPEDVWSIVFPYSVDTRIYKPRPRLKKEYDVMAVFGLVSYVYPDRPKVQKFIQGLPGITSLIGDWKSKIKHLKYAEAINKSRIFVSVNGIHNQILMKYTEAMASGTLLLTNRPQDFEMYGYRPGKHCVVWKDLNDLKKKIYYYKMNSSEREKIAKEGMKFVTETYSCDIAADILLDEFYLYSSLNEEPKRNGKKSDNSNGVSNVCWEVNKDRER